jgi:hypothetical protein
MKTIELTRTGEYSYGKCDCCGKKFTRRSRGSVFGKNSNGMYYACLPWEMETGKTFTFENVPQDEELTLVKLGTTCIGKQYDLKNTVNI